MAKEEEIAPTFGNIRPGVKDGVRAERVAAVALRGCCRAGYFGGSK